MIRSEQQNKMKFTLFAAILFSIGWMSAVVADEGPSPNCCLRVSKTKISVEAIMNYSMQAAPPCPIRATETSTSTPVPTTMKTKKTRLEKVISKTTIQPASGTEENQESTAIRCGTSEKTAPPAETTRTRVTKTTKKLPKMMRRKKGKSKKGLRKFQMGYAHT
uniref:Uncharacterized protein n=1 Tax=Cyprinus carpio carpio TaxID=630221 RepID=A0A9J7ZAV7_CYPCA